jgi:ABC-type nitrate/sulfonate/bicarbonate transport system substrate-binding protein
VVLVVTACGGGPEPATEPEAPSEDEAVTEEDTTDDESEADADTDSAAGGEPEVTDVSIRLSWVPQWQFAGYIVAEANGYYDEAGLNVTLNGGGPEFPEVQMVAGGSDDFGTSWPDSVLQARENDINLLTLATFFQTSPTAYMVHADSGIEGPEDFVGKSVAVFLGGGLESEYRGMMAATGVDTDEINEVPGEFNLEPFLSRRVDVWPVYATDQPNTVRNQGVEIDLIYARDFGVTMIGDSLFTTEEFATENPNTTQAVVSASLRGWNWAAENPEEAVEIVSEYNSEIDVDQLTFEAEETIPLLEYGVGETCIGLNDQDAWQSEYDMLVELGVLEGTAELEESFTNEFVEAYYAEQGVECP